MGDGRWLKARILIRWDCLGRIATHGGHWAQVLDTDPPPPQENYPADAHPSALKSVLESANPAWTRSVHLDAPGQLHGQQPVSGTADPGVVKQDKSSRGSVDTTKTRSGPQRVRMSSGERPIGAAKGKQSDREALYQPPSPPWKLGGKCRTIGAKGTVSNFA